jgi:uncharacterized protein (DUF4415 family)
MIGEQDYAEGFPARKKQPETLGAKQEAWSTAHWESGHSRTHTNTETVMKLSNETAAALVYITALEQQSTAARAEIARLTAELAARDAAWSEAVKLNEAQAVNLKIDAALIETYREEIDNLQAENAVLRRDSEREF